MDTVIKINRLKEKIKNLETYLSLGLCENKKIKDNLIALLGKYKDDLKVLQTKLQPPN